jgi:hypothetical protein
VELLRAELEPCQTRPKYVQIILENRIEHLDMCNGMLFSLYKSITNKGYLILNKNGDINYLEFPLFPLWGLDASARMCSCLRMASSSPRAARLQWPKIILVLIKIKNPKCLYWTEKK